MHEKDCDAGVDKPLTGFGKVVPHGDEVLEFGSFLSGHGGALGLCRDLSDRTESQHAVALDLPFIGRTMIHPCPGKTDLVVPLVVLGLHDCEVIDASSLGPDEGLADVAEPGSFGELPRVRGVDRVDDEGNYGCDRVVHKVFGNIRGGLTSKLDFVGHDRLYTAATMELTPGYAIQVADGYTRYTTLDRYNPDVLGFSERVNLTGRDFGVAEEAELYPP